MQFKIDLLIANKNLKKSTKKEKKKNLKKKEKHVTLSIRTSEHPAKRRNLI